MRSQLPPKWAERFLTWYCNPELLEEIQGDAHELYAERLGTRGRFVANVKYIWDVIRFCRVSNIRRTEEFNEPGFFGLLWNLNMKIAVRNSAKNKTIFFVKVTALSICLAFTLLLTGFVINELSYDHHHARYNDVYRVVMSAESQGKTSNYATTPLPLGDGLASEIPQIDMYSRFMILHAPMFRVKEDKFFGIQAYAADTSFLSMFHHEYLHGTSEALSGPNRVVLTESLAMRLFGETNVLGQSIDLGWTFLEVTAVVRDLPLNTHFTYEALVSWSTFQRDESWDNINAYTYIRTMSGSERTVVEKAVNATMNDYMKLIFEEYNLKASTSLQSIDEIHLSEFLDEDFAPKRSRNYIYIFSSVIVLFLFTGLFNYLNLALAELTTQVKKIAILRTFGGINADHKKVALTDGILCLAIVAPLVVVLMLFLLSLNDFLAPIDRSVWTSLPFLAFVVGLPISILLFSRLNSIVISRGELILSSARNKAVGPQSGFGVRKLLVAAQLAFSIIMIGLIVVIVDQFNFLNEADKGFDDSDVIVVTRPGRYEHTLAFEQVVRGLSGVSAVSGSSFYPEGGVETKDLFEVEGESGLKKMLVNYINCEEDYGKLLGLELVAGRFFDARSTDKKGAYVINETAAKQFGWANAIGKKISGPVNADGRVGEVVGVVKDFHSESMHSRIEPLIIFLNDGWDINFVYIKIEPAKSAHLIPMFETEFRKIFPDLPFDFGFLDARYRGLYKKDYEVRDIFRWGLIVSIVVSSLGIFSISALMLSIRTKEMGIRKVVGAANGQLFVMHLKPFFIFFAIAAAIGLPIVYLLSRRWLDNFAYHIDISVSYFLLPALATIVIILGASIYHAIRSALVNPVEILKQE
jgi:putative ABC transport system permease protein